MSIIKTSGGGSGGGGGGVTSLNSLTGALNIVAGSNITVTPAGSNITIASTGGGGTPGGSNKQVQFNDSGSFGGDTNFQYDKTTDVLTVGSLISATAGTGQFKGEYIYAQIAGNSPQNPLHVGGTTGPTIGPVTGASCTQTAEVIDASPTFNAGGSFLLAQSALAGNTPTPTQDVGVGYGFIANGQTFDYFVTPYLTISGTKYGGTISAAGSYTDTINDGTTEFRNSITFSATTDASGYILSRQINGGGVESVDIGNVTSYFDNAFTGTAPAPAGWPTTYLSNVSVNSCSSFDSASQNLSGTGYTCNGQTIDYQIDTYVTANGIKYISGAPVSISFTDAINDGTTLFSVDLVWTPPGGGYNGLVLRKSFDAGATWTYIELGPSSSYTDDNYADDGSGSIWANPFSGFTGTDFTFRVYGKTLAPVNSAVIYSDTPNQYTFTIPNDNVPRIIYHAYSGIPAAGFKVLGVAATSYSNGLNGTASFFDPGYDTWANGTTVTPNHYAFTGTAINRSYKIYSYSTVGAIRYYTATAVTVSMTDPGSGYYYAILAYTLPGGAAGARITRSINGGAYDAGFDVVSPTAGATDVAIVDQWTTSPSAVVVTPTTVQQVPARFDRDTTATNLLPSLEAVSVAASSPMTSMFFSTSASSSTAATTLQAKVGADASSRFYIDAEDANKTLYIGTYSAPHTIINNSITIFNNPGVDNDFLVKATSVSNMFSVDAGLSTVFIGAPAGSFGTTVNAQLAIKTTIDADDLVVLERSNSFSGYFIKLRNNSGSFFTGFNSAGILEMISTGSDTGPNIQSGGTGTGLSMQATKTSHTVANVSKLIIGSASTVFKGNSVVMQDAALSTSATAGFTYIPTCAGAPSGTPGTQTGTVAMVYDTTNNQLCIYTSGAWKKVTLT